MEVLLSLASNPCSSWSSWPFYDVETGECVETCSAYLDVDDNTCYSGECPEGKNRIVGSDDSWPVRCASKCPGEYLLDAGRHECVLKCPDDSPFVEIDGSCVGRCKSSNYVEIVDESGSLTRLKCLQFECPHYFELNESNGDSHRCVNECPDGKYFSYEKHCLKMCPEAAPFATTVTPADENLGENSPERPRFTCSAKCSPKQFVLDNFAYTDPDGTETRLNIRKCEKCANLKVRDAETKHFRCVDSCPPETPYADSPESKTCTAECAFYYFTEENEKMCTKSCPASSDAPFYVPSLEPAQKCVPACPGLPFAEESSGKCLKRCASGYVVKNANSGGTDEKSPEFFCLQSAGCGPDLLEAARTAGGTEVRECVSQCPENTLLQDTQCVERCADARFARLVDGTRTCAPECGPAENAYYRDEKGQKVCVPDCSGDRPLRVRRA